MTTHRLWQPTASGQPAPHAPATPVASPAGGGKTAAAKAGETIYYKFNEAGGGLVTNYPSAPAGSWTPGKYRTALLGGVQAPTRQHNRVETGWAPGSYTGSLTIAAYLRVPANTPTPGLNYLLGVPVSGQARFFSGGSQKVIAPGFTNATLFTTAQVFALAKAGWVHLALVIDSTANTATYYVNGVAETPITITRVSVAATTFNVGQQVPSLGPSVFHSDEFCLLTCAATAAEFMAWSTRADAAYGKGGGATMVSMMGVPSVGNVNYALEAKGASNRSGSLAVGLKRDAIGPLRLPFDLGTILSVLAGCSWETITVLVLAFTTDNSGRSALPLPIQNNPTFASQVLYSQAILLPGGQQQTTNAFASAIE